MKTLTKKYAFLLVPTIHLVVICGLTLTAYQSNF